MTSETARSRKISSVDDLQKYLVCMTLYSEIYITLPEKYLIPYYSTRGKTLKKVEGINSVHKYTQNDLKSLV